MRPSDLAIALKRLLPTRRPLYLWGPPGVGKSSVVSQAAKELNLQLVDVRATLLDPIDLRGVPRVNGTQTEWCPPVFLPTAGSGVLFLDELAQAPPLVQSACMQLVLDRKLGEYELPPEWVVVAASNRQEDRAGAHRLISPLLNRFVHLDMEVSEADWQEWAIIAGIAPEVRAFLRYRPKLLFEFDPKVNQRAFATPRSWHFVSDLLSQTPPDLLHPVIAGCVGDGPAAEFVAFVQLYHALPDIDLVLAQPDTANVPREPALLYALVGAVTERLRQGQTPSANVARYFTRFPDEFAMLGMRDAMAVDKKLVSLPEVQGWIASSRRKGLFLAA